MADEPQRPVPIEPLNPPKVSTAKKGGIAAATLAVILGAVYVNEGGFTDNPNDPGGATNYGVTLQVARANGYHGDMKDFPKHCKGPADICADGIYVQKYIAKPGYMPIIELSPAVGQELVDSAVNFGPPRPSQWFQQSLNELCGTRLVTDGKIGQQTIGAYSQCSGTRADLCVAMLDRLDAKQKAEYDRLVRNNTRLKVFYKGWIKNRIGNVDRKKCSQGA